MIVKVVHNNIVSPTARVLVFTYDVPMSTTSIVAVVAAVVAATVVD